MRNDRLRQAASPPHQVGQQPSDKGVRMVSSERVGSMRDGHVEGDSRGTQGAHVGAAGDGSALTKQCGGDHYRNMAIQPIEFIHANGIPFAEGSVIKYVSRWRAKNGIADLEKARHFIDLLIELERKKLGATASVASNPEGWHACGNVGMEASE